MNAAKMSLEPGNPGLSRDAPGRFQKAPETLSLGQTIVGSPRKTRCFPKTQSEGRDELGMDSGSWN